jgi:peroxiredoxin
MPDADEAISISRSLQVGREAAMNAAARARLRLTLSSSERTITSFPALSVAHDAGTFLEEGQTKGSDGMSLRIKLEALTASMETAGGAGMPTADDAVARLVSEEERARPLRVGDLAPAFTLPAYGGARVSSVDYLRSGPLVVTFYRGLWCPYCRRDLQSFTDAMTAIKETDASVVAVSRPRPPGVGSSSDHEPGLAFPLLEDEAGDVAVAFGIRWSAEDSRLIEAALGLDLATFRGTAPWIVPMQARFVIDRQGVVAFAEAAFDYSERSEPADLVPLLASLQYRG